MSYRKRSGILTAIIIVLIIAIIVGMLAIFTSGFKNWNPSTWFGQTEETPDNEKQGLVVGEINSTTPRIALASAVSNDGTTTTFTATVKDSEGGAATALQYVEWSMSWGTDNIANVTDFVTIETEGTTATLTCKSAFTTQIILTCTSTLDPTVKATATLDYAKRVINTSAKFRDVVASGLENESIVNVGFPKYSEYTPGNSVWNGASLYFYTAAVFGDGTVGDKINSVGYTVRANAGFKTELNAVNSSVTANGTISAGGSVSNASAGKSISDFCDGICGTTGILNTQYGYALFKALSSTTNQFTVTVNVTTQYRKYTADYILNITVEAPSVNAIDLNTEGFVFLDRVIPSASPKYGGLVF